MEGVADVFGGRLKEIELRASVNPPVVQVGDTIRLSTLGYVDGIAGLLVTDRVLDARWQSSDSTVATVPRTAQQRSSVVRDSTSTSEALVWGLRPGTALITATARGVTGQLIVRVTPRADAAESR